MNIPTNLFFYFMSIFFLLYIFYHAFNVINIALNILALALIPGSVQLANYLEDPIYKITLLIFSCFISGVLIIYNQRNLKNTS
jgi:cbb3-type cytochrome oxidase subunit 3